MKKIFPLTTLIVWFIMGCSHQQKTDFVAVTIEPQRYFAEKIAGDKFHIYTVVPAGQSPETYDATPRQMLNFNRCIAYLLVGNMGFEQVWIRNILDNNRNMKVFNLSEGFNFIRGDDEHNSQHSGVDPHLWSSIEGAKIISRNTLNAFISLDGDNESFYRQNYNILMKEIETTDSIIRSKIGHLSGNAFIIYHPALTYFAQEFNLTQLCIELDGKEPSPTQLKELMDAVKTQNVKVIFIQQEFDRNNAQRIAEATGCRLVNINLQAYEWDKEMIKLANALSYEE